MNTKYMTEYEKEMLAFMKELNELKTTVHNIDKRMTYVKEKIDFMHERFFDLEDKYGK